MSTRLATEPSCWEATVRRNLLRAVVALLTVLAGLAVSAGPASATTISARVNSGTVTVAKAGQPGFTFPLVSTGAGCGSTATTIDFAVTGTTGPVTLPTYTTASRFLPFGGTTYYVAEVTRATGTGTAGTGDTTTSPDTITGLGVDLTTTFSAATDQTATGTSCAHGTAVCTWTATYAFGGTYSGNLSAPAPGDTATIGTPASTALTGTPCNSPFSAYTSGNATVVSMALQNQVASYPIDVTNGTLTVTKTGYPLLTIPLVDCGTTGQLDVNVFGATGPVDLSALTITSRFQYLGIPFIAVITRTASTSGTGTASTGAITGAGATIRIRTHTVASYCTPGTLVCTWNSTHTFGGTYSGNLNAPAMGDVAYLSSAGATLALGGACGAPIAGYSGGTATFNTMGLQLL